MKHNRFKILQILLILILVPELISSQNNWTSRTSLPGMARYAALGLSTFNKGYVLMGDSYFSGYLKDNWEYDPNLDNWSQKADLPGPARRNAKGFTLNNKLYIGSGLDSINNDLFDFWEFDPNFNSWTQKNNLPTFMLGRPIDAFSIADTGYLITNASELWRYHKVSDSWSPMLPFPAGNHINSISFVIGSKAYFGTGNFTNDIWSYNQANETWLQVADLPGNPRKSGIAFTINNLGYAGTGQDTVGWLNDFYQYDPSLNNWTPIANFQPIADAISFSIGNRAFAGTGAPPFPQPLPTFYEYIPFTSLEEFMNFSISVFPNPFSSTLILKFENEPSFELKVNIFNTNGKIIYHREKLKIENTMFFENLESGIYYLELSNNTKVLYYHKIICIR